MPDRTILALVKLATIHGQVEIRSLENKKKSIIALKNGLISWLGDVSFDGEALDSTCPSHLQTSATIQTLKEE